jgi:HrpA-like RNA helicase
MTKYIRPDGILDLERKYNNPFTGKQQPYLPSDHISIWKNAISLLNVYKERAKIFKGLHNNQVMLFTAGTGAGKTVIMPLLVLHYFNYEKVICTQPRKNLVDNQTEFSSLLLGVPVNIKDKDGNVLVPDTGLRYVGKQYGGGLAPGWITKDTKLIWATDAMIKVLITGGDEYLEGVNAVLIDESHERSMHIDILMALCLKICKKRPEFKVIIMSATIDTKFFMDYFDRMGLGNNSIHIHVDGVGVKLPPGIKAVTDVFYDDIYPKSKSISSNSRIKTTITEVDKLLKNSDEMERIFGDDNYENYDIPRGKPKRFYKYGRDILIFAPTMTMIDEIITSINSNIDKYKYKPKCVAYNRNTSFKTEGIIAVSGDSLSNPELMGSEVDKYDLKIIVATNSAEAGVTFKDPLAYVFETGLQNNEFFRPNEYLYETGIFDIAKDNIKQRRGRTGRINPGICRYMYTKVQYDKFKEFKDTDITQNDITDDILSLMTTKNYNTVDTSIEFLKDMIEPVEHYKDIIKVAYRNLLDNDFIDKNNGELNNFGRICAKFGLYGYKVARIIIMGYHLGILKEAIYMGAIIYSLNKMNELFKTENDNKKIAEQKAKILSNFINPLGDHLSMFNLFVEWLKVPEYQKQLWEQTYNIEYIKLNMIHNAVLDIANIFLKIKDDVIKLNMFYNADKYKFNLSGGSDLNILSNSKLLLNPFDIELNNISLMTGGNNLDYFNKDISIKEIIKKTYNLEFKDKELLNSIEDKKKYLKKNIKEPIKKNIKEPIKKNIKKNIKEPIKKDIKEPIKKDIKEPIKKDIKEPIKKDIKKNTVKKFNKNQQKEKILKELYSSKFDFKYIYNENEPIKLRGIKNMTVIDRLYLATCFGFINTNIGIYNTLSNEKKTTYIVKYSNIEADIKNSVIHKYLKRTPKYIIYEKFSKTYNGNSLSLVSELLPEVINIFNNFKYNM